ncbi:hypothetical protein I203_107583 [Kwoniella mangroviensis CBS 8507]|uniref:hypothetical protein n=1 Tax=Kwoniella mangroviensis CBS 8507 TaxID=1296122 RepID=UPI00080CE2C0|nr:uncharacterized protein I203_02331 [Kwoniella mangroviensis CBS 8507]OCF68937.1 hypothetical protein I203_02331 [Kwoniella mangroviensis CBS 8507]
MSDQVGPREVPAQTHEPSSKEGLDFVQDGYFRHSDIVFRYVDKLSPLHAQAMGQLINGHALCHPNHPLRTPGDGGLTLYVGTDLLGKPRLLWKIQQLQYLQYYIHEMRLTTPSWIEYHSKRAELLAEEGEDKADKLEPPSLEEGNDDWVPLPSYPCRASDMVIIQPIKIISSGFLKELSKLVTKDGKTVERYRRQGVPIPTFDPHRYEALRDNFTEGPGLRKGPEKSVKSDAARQEAPDGTGWGGFPLKKENKVDKNEEEESLDVKTSVPESYVEFDVAAPPAAHQANRSTSPSISSNTSTPFTDIGASYYYHCQQAFILAISGGLLASLPDSQQSVAGEEDAEEEEGLITIPEIGRSLFIALSVTRWEKDPSTMLEIGYSAIWWEKVPDELKKEDGMDYEEMRDMGHFIVQDHLLHKKNGESQPDYRDSYLFGDSLPIEASKIRTTLKKLIKDLSAKAGNGPIYIVTHVSEGEELNLKDIGLDVSLTDGDLQPDGWEVPPYMCAAGCGSVFIINTASLFGAIENVPPIPVGSHHFAGRTKRTLETTALTTFGSDPNRRPEKCGNAGNDAFYTLAILVETMTGPTLPELRADYLTNCLPSSHLKAGSMMQEGPEEEVKVIRTVPLTPLGEASTTEQGETPEVVAASERLKGIKVEDVDVNYEDNESDDEGFREDEMITGIYYEDEDGNLHELSD